MSRRTLLYGFELSYFTRKMEAALNLHAVPFQRRPKTLLMWRRLERRAGTGKVPVLIAPDGRVLSDTTPMIDDLDLCRPERRLFPVGIDGVVVRLVEEWLDEWFPRTVIHYRWQHRESAAAASAALAREVAPWLPGPLRRPLERRIAAWGRRACRAVGLSETDQQRSALREAADVWGALEAQLGETPYALGWRPTAVDAVLIGALRGHFLADPTPRRMLDQFERVRAWVGSADRWDGTGEPLPFPRRTAFADTILERMAGPYRSWILAHARALRRGERSFTAEVDGAEVSFRTLRPPDPVSSRRYLLNRLRSQLSEEERSRVERWLAALGLDDVFPLGARPP